MLKNIIRFILLLSTLMLFVTSCKKDKSDENSDYPVTINIGEDSFSWHKDDGYAAESTLGYSVYIQVEHQNSMFQMRFISEIITPNWLTNINNTEFQITGEEGPNYVVFELKEPQGDISLGTYTSQSGTIKVTKVKNQKIYLSFTVKIENIYTDEIITVEGEIDGMPYTTQE